MKKKIFSIVLLLLLFIGWGVVSYVVDEHRSLTSPLQPSPTMPAATPTASILQLDTKAIKLLGQNFYQAYSGCMTNPPIEAKGKVSSYCQESTGFTTDAFMQNLKEVGTARMGGDPITCSQKPPSSVAIGDVVYDDPERAIVTAIASAGASAQKIPVQVVKGESGWKVDSVICPRP